MSTTWLYVFMVVMVIYVLSPMTSDACMCAKEKTLQEHYCDAAFVIKTRIKKKMAIFDKNSSMPTVPMAIRYTVKTTKVFKLNETKHGKINEHELYTGATSCGLHMLNIGKVYAIAGRIRNGQLWAEMCEFAEQWSKLSPHQIKFMHWKYRKHCDCSINTNGRKTPKACKTTYNNWLCYAKHSYCEVATTERRHCRWQMNKPLKDCLLKLEP